MKTTKLILSAGVIITLASCGKETPTEASTTETPTISNQKTVPASIKDAFNKKFTAAKEVNWDKENATEWEAEFNMNGNKY